MVMLPSSGTLMGSTRTTVDPHKIGRVLWSQDSNGLYGPLDLHDYVPVVDMMALNRVFKALMSFRKVTPALEIIRDQDWVQWSKIKPYLIASIDNRASAREMVVSDEWEPFWNSVDFKCVHS